MKTSFKLFLLPILALPMFTTSCFYAGPNTKTGAVAGGLLGAGTGVIVGHQRGRELEGAAIGGAVGAAAGGLLGSAQDDRDYYSRSNRGQGGGHGYGNGQGGYYQHPHRY